AKIHKSHSMKLMEMSSSHTVEISQKDKYITIVEKKAQDLREELKAQAKHSDGILRVTQERIAELEAIEQQGKKRIEDLERELDKYSSQVRQGHAKEQELEEEKSALLLTHDQELDSFRQLASSEKKALQKKLDRQIEDSQAKILQLTGELRMQSAFHEKQSEQIRTELLDLRAENIRLKDVVKRSEEELEIAREEARKQTTGVVEQEQREKQDLDKRLIGATRKVAILENELKKQAVVSDNELDIKTKENLRLQTELTDTKRLLSDQTAELKRLRTRSSDADIAEESLHILEQTSKEKESQLRAELQDVRDELKTVQEDLGAERVVASSAQHKVKELSEELKVIGMHGKGTVQFLEESKIRLEAERKDLQHKLEAERSEWDSERARLESNLTREREEKVKMKDESYQHESAATSKINELRKELKAQHAWMETQLELEKERLQQEFASPSLCGKPGTYRDDSQGELYENFEAEKKKRVETEELLKRVIRSHQSEVNGLRNRIRTLTEQLRLSTTGGSFLVLDGGDGSPTGKKQMQITRKVGEAVGYSGPKPSIEESSAIINQDHESSSSTISSSSSSSSLDAPQTKLFPASHAIGDIEHHDQKHGSVSKDQHEQPKRDRSQSCRRHTPCPSEIEVGSHNNNSDYLAAEEHKEDNPATMLSSGIVDDADEENASSSFPNTPITAQLPPQVPIVKGNQPRRSSSFLRKLSPSPHVLSRSASIMDKRGGGASQGRASVSEKESSHQSVIVTDDIAHIDSGNGVNGTVVVDSDSYNPSGKVSATPVRVTEVPVHPPTPVTEDMPKRAIDIDVQGHTDDTQRNVGGSLNRDRSIEGRIEGRMGGEKEELGKDVHGKVDNE
ncbi:hypothetical protein ADUPG1_006966, partial [Aduncisulcus paluster]